MNICILIPVYNESKAIGGIVKAIKEKGLDVVVVDDGSTDRSGEIAKEQGAHVIVHSQKNGKGYSLIQGLQYIIAQGYDGIIMMDGDGQHCIDDIDQFVQKAQQEPRSIITGNRMHNPSEMPFIRRLTNRLMSKPISFVCKQKIPDTQCGFRYIHPEIVKHLYLKCLGYEIESEILMKAAKKGYPIHSVAVKTIYSDEESHIHPVKDAFRFIIYFFKEVLSPE